MSHRSEKIVSDSSQSTTAERQLKNAPDDEITALADALYAGFHSDSHPLSRRSNSGHGTEAARAIDDLIRKRIGEALTAGAASFERS